MQTENKYEKAYWANQQLVVGIDEAGRGPLAGPLVVAGVVFDRDYDSKEIYDSKKLTEKKREELFIRIKEDALFYMIVVVDEATIDRLNIYQATKAAMSAIGKRAPVGTVLTDAMELNIGKETISLIKGDQQSCSIAAASILAKVTRDHMMLKLDERYPEYHFAKNKGYPTKDHLEALQKYGVSEIHRRSYGPVANALQEKLF